MFFIENVNYSQSEEREIYFPFFRISSADITQCFSSKLYRNAKRKDGVFFGTLFVVSLNNKQRRKYKKLSSLDLSNEEIDSVLGVIDHFKLQTRKKISPNNIDYRIDSKLIKEAYKKLYETVESRRFTQLELF